MSQQSPPPLRGSTTHCPKCNSVVRAQPKDCDTLVQCPRCRHAFAPPSSQAQPAPSPHARAMRRRRSAPSTDGQQLQRLAVFWGIVAAVCFGVVVLWCLRCVPGLTATEPRKSRDPGSRVEKPASRTPPVKPVPSREHQIEARGQRTPWAATKRGTAETRKTQRSRSCLLGDSHMLVPSPRKTEVIPFLPDMDSCEVVV